MEPSTLFNAHWSIGIYYGINKCAHLYNVQLSEAAAFLGRELDEGQHWSIYCHDDHTYYEFSDLLPFFNSLNNQPSPMTNSNIPQLQAQVEELTRKLAAARNRYDKKKKEVLRSIQADSPNLFGERAAQSSDKLFYEPVDTRQIPEALAPLQIEMQAIERELERTQNNLMTAAQRPEPTLF